MREVAVNINTSKLKECLERWEISLDTRSYFPGGFKRNDRSCCWYSGSTQRPQLRHLRFSCL